MVGRRKRGLGYFTSTASVGFFEMMSVTIVCLLDPPYTFGNFAICLLAHPAYGKFACVGWVKFAWLEFNAQLMSPWC